MHFESLELPPTADFHVHLRDGEMTKMIVPDCILSGGVDTVYVMPNLQPPIASVSEATAYRERLQSLAPNVTFLMTLYLCPSITPSVIFDAAKAGIAGVKSYPAGVTTNSDAGVVDYQQYYPTFAAMEEHDLVLNLHGEVPSTPGSDVTVLNAEAAFLPTLHDLHRKFPRLRIVLEHCTTKAALDAVRACESPLVGATITAHHLYLTVDDWCCDPFSFCKPVAKLPSDRDALIKAVCSGDPRFFFGSDSAPHSITAKRGGGRRVGKTAAGIFTQPVATQLVVLALKESIERGVISEDEVTQERLGQFLSTFGRQFYKMPLPQNKRIVLEKKGERIPESVTTEDESIEVVIFRGGQETLSLRWIST